MSEATVNEVAVHETTVNDVTLSEARVNEATGLDPLSATGGDEPEVSESAAPPELYAVKMTAEEWAEQEDLQLEIIDAVKARDREKVEEIERRMIYPSFILKGIKEIRGANYIRRVGLNTVDADLVYGPGWLDEDDGGPLVDYYEED